MAQSLLAKLRIVVLGNAHDLLDKLIDMNSPAALRQHIRDLEKAIEDLEGEAVNAQGDMKTQGDKLIALNAQTKELQASVDLILNDGNEANDYLAEPLMAKLMGLEQQRQPLTQEVEGYQQTMVALDQTTAGLKAKKEAMLSQVNLIEQQSKAAKAKNKAADAIEAAAQLTSGQSVDNIVERAKQEANRADARLGRVMSDTEKGLGADAQIAAARVRLAARKAELAQGAQK